MSGGALERVKEYPLSDGDIRRVLGNEIKIFTYPQLKSLRSADQLFDSKGRCIILYLTEGPNVGHWCCLMKRGDTIDFFDPYGDSPEEVKDGIPRSRLESLDMDSPYLTRLLRGSGRKVFYNRHQYQKQRGDINTCGRHCVTRLLYAPLTEDKYYKVVQSSGLSPDDFVSGMTFGMLRK